MTSRSIVLGTAALLLMSAAAPLQIGFSPTAAFAQEVSLDAAMAGNPSEFNGKQLRDRIKVLRAAIQDGTLTGSNRQAAQEKIKAYREALEGVRTERQEARQERQAEQPTERERTQRQRQPDRNADERAAEQRNAEQRQAGQRQAEQRQAEQRQAERQAQRKAERQAQREAERQAQGEAEQRKAERQAQRKAERQAEREAERQAEREAERQAQRQAEQRQEEQRQAEQRKAERQAERKDERQAAREAQREAERQAERQAARQAERQAEPQAEPEEVSRRARENLADNRPAADLDNQELRQRLNQSREVLATGQLSRAQTQELRQQLRADREELRARVAARQEQQEEAREPTRSGSNDQSRGSDDRMSGKNVSRIIEERTPSGQLTERELEERVRVLSRALKAGNITVRQAEVARLLIDRDREELRARLYAERDRRRDRRRSGSSDDFFIEFEVGYRPPPVIYAAEAMPRDIQMQLVAPPLYQTQRAYSVREIATNHDVREAMPGIEIDTLNFDFGSAEVRPEEIEKLDEIGMVIESIVAERPDEVFLIEGHTDAVGSDAANDALSQQRAQAVVEALLDYFIIDPENLQTVGLGERFLKIPTPEPEEENRRVTVRRITPLLAGRG